MKIHKFKTNPVYKETFTSKKMHKNAKLKTSPVYKENFTSIKICIRMLS